MATSLVSCKLYRAGPPSGRQGQFGEQRGWTHAKMEANPPPQPLPAFRGHGVAEDSSPGRRGRSDRVHGRIGLPLRPHTGGNLLARIR